MSDLASDSESGDDITFTKTRLSCSNGSGSTPPVHAGVLINTALATTWVALQSNPADAVTKSLAQLFSSDTIKEAKKILWDACSDAVIGKRKSRRDTMERTETFAHSKDIVSAMLKLDQNSALPIIAVNALDVHRMPTLCKEVSNEATAMRDAHRGMEPLAQRLTGVEDLCSELKVMVASLSEQVARSSPTLYPTLQIPKEKPLPSTKQRNHKPVNQAVRNEGTKESHVPPAPQGKSYVDFAAEAADGDDDWTKVGKKRTKIIKGTQESCGRFQGAPEPKRDLFVYRVSKECEPDDIRAMLKAKNCEVEDITVMSKAEAKFRSFKVSLKVSLVATLLSEEFPWPLGVRVRRFYKRSNTGKKDSNSLMPDGNSASSHNGQG